MLFSSESEDREKLIRQCEAVITDQFDLTIPVTVMAVEELADTIRHAPDWWNQEKETVHYAIFMIAPMTVSEVFSAVGEINPDYEKIAHHGEVIFGRHLVKHSIRRAGQKSPVPRSINR